MRQAILPIVQLVHVSQRLPRQAVFSGRTAAWLHGLDMDPCSPIEVTVPRRSPTSHLARIALTRSDTTDGEVWSVQGLRATSPTRTVADLGRRLPFTEAVVVLDMALHRRLITLDQLRGWADSHPGFHGVRQLRRAMEVAEPAAESAMETRLRLLLVLSRLPPPVAQAPLSDESGLFLARADLYYPSSRLAIEYDGMTHRSSLAADNRRQNRLLEAGYRLLRFTASDVLASPASVVAQVSRALGRSGYSSSSG